MESPEVDLFYRVVQACTGGSAGCLHQYTSQYIANCGSLWQNLPAPLHSMCCPMTGLTIYSKHFLHYI